MTPQSKAGYGFTFGSTDGNGLRVAVSTNCLPYPQHQVRTMQVTVGKLLLFSGLVDASSIEASKNLMLELLDGNPSELAEINAFLDSLMPKI